MDAYVSHTSLVNTVVLLLRGSLLLMETDAIATTTWCILPRKNAHHFFSFDCIQRTEPERAKVELVGAMCVVVLSSSNLNSMLSKSSSSCFYRHQCLAYSCHIKKLSKTRTEQFTWTVTAFWHGAWLLWSTLAWCLVTVIYSGMVLSYCDLLWHGTSHINLICISWLVMQAFLLCMHRVQWK